jgi:hypothetical protein
VERGACLTAGVAIGVPFGGGVAWPADWAGRFEIVSSQLLDGRIAPFVGARVGAVCGVAGGAPRRSRCG